MNIRLSSDRNRLVCQVLKCQQDLRNFQFIESFAVLIICDIKIFTFALLIKNQYIRITDSF